MGKQKKRGYYSFVSTLFVPQGNRGKKYNIKHSWLPLLSEDNDPQLELISKTKAFKNRTVFPALNEKSHAAIAAILDLYAIEKNLDSQSTLFRFRPNAFDKYEEEGEDATIIELRTRIRDRSLTERAVIESHNQSESIGVLEDMLTLMEGSLKQEGITTEKSLQNSQLRYRVSALLSTYPFLAFALFDQLPKLCVLYVSGEISGVKSVYALIRHAGGKLVIDESWAINERLVHVGGL